MRDIKYDHEVLSNITAEYDSNIKRLNELKERLARDMATIKTNWTDEESAIAERDKDFKVIEESVNKIVENFNSNNKFIKERNERFHSIKY